MKQDEADSTMRDVINACADCDVCRFLMDDNCLFFPELYRLFDQEKETGEPTKADKLRKLADFCTLCGLCPCPNIRADIIRSKSERIQTEGMPFHIQLLADIQQLGQWSRLSPKTINNLFSFSPVSRTVKWIAGIHPQRNLPQLAHNNFFVWANKKKLYRKTHNSSKVAYFAGCTAGYFFTKVAQATVKVLQHNGVCVHVPPQQCCGMPTLLEGDRQTTLDRVRFNLKNLLKTLEEEYKIVCSCPTCGYLMKILLKEGAFFSKTYQESINADADEIVVPGKVTGSVGLVHLKKSMYEKILKDDGYFSNFDPMQRITLSENIMDIGEYFNLLHQDKKLNLRFKKLHAHMAYYAPCHQREQGIGSPYIDLLNMIPGLTIEAVGNKMDCCGMGGSLGFKKDFYDASLHLAKTLIQKIKVIEPDAIITDCLSCRLQFQHLLPYPVYHPIEILSQVYH